MDLIRWAINRPVSVAVGVILLVLSGLIGLRSIPVQLTPSVDAPTITVSTIWPGRSPEEVVDEITQEQEKRLKNVPNLLHMTSLSKEGSSEITLEFYLDADINRAMQEVSDALRQVPAYPDEVDQPTIKAAEGSAQNAIAWIIIDLSDEGLKAIPDFDISTLFDPVDKEVRPFVERIEGVAECNIYGGREREVRVMLDPVRLAQRGLNQVDVIAALRGENRNTSAGSISEGKRDYRVRVVGQFETARDVMETIIAYRPGGGLSAGTGALKPVYVRDVGEVEIGHTKARGFVRSQGAPCLAMNVIRKGNANSMEVMAELRVRLEEVQKELMPKLDPVAGPYLRIRQVYDETEYIQSAIDLVKENLWQGGVLAALVLLIFLRSLVSTGLVAMAIPLAVIGAFLVLLLAGRTLNVVSLAGLAFSVGMGIDNAIVVLENIFRRRQLGDGPFEAAYRGAREVWGAILASTLTNVAVFLPVITIREESGQLFRDIALAATASVFISLVVAITVLPTAAARWLGPVRPPGAPRGRLRTVWEDLFGLTRLLAGLTRRFSHAMLWLMTGWRSWSLRPAIIILMTAASLYGGWRLMPPLDYLPAGNQNLVFGFLLVPPGYSVEQQVEIAHRVEAVARPYWEADITRPETVAALPKVQAQSFGPGPPAPIFDGVPIDNIFVVGFTGAMFAGATSQDPERVIPVGVLLSKAMNTSPDSFGMASQTSIFGRGIGGGNSINVEISGPDLERVRGAAVFMRGAAMGLMGGIGFTRPDPSNFDLGQPENRVRVNGHGRELGLTAEAVGVAVRGLFDGAFVDDFRLGSDTVDMVVLPKGGRLLYKEQLASIPIATPSGAVVPIDTVVDIVETSSPQEIQRIEELPSVKLIVTPPPGRPVEEVMQEIREKIIAPAEAAGVLDSSMRVRLEGTAAKLDDVRAAMFGRAPPPLPPGVRPGLLQRAAEWLSVAVVAGGLIAAAYAVSRAVKRRGRGQGRGGFIYGAVGVLAAALIVAGLMYGLANQPQLLTARFIWALAVTYLLMCSLYESFVYPLAIMFSVPLAVVGGFAGLALVHAWTLANPTKPAQNLDVLTMLGFIILIGIVVNNAILLVEQALNLMHPERLGEIAKGEKPLPPLEAIAESIRTRMRPIFMSTLTSVFGTVPLAAYPGAGSEMYRGIGAVLIGGQLVSTIFTLVLVPLVFSLVVDLRSGVQLAFGRRGTLTSAGAGAAPVLADPG